MRGALGLQFPAQRNVGAVPPVVVVHRQPDAEFHIAPELLGPLLPQVLTLRPARSRRWAGFKSRRAMPPTLSCTARSAGRSLFGFVFSDIAYSSVTLAGMASFFSNLRYSAVISFVAPMRRRWPWSSQATLLHMRSIWSMEWLTRMTVVPPDSSSAMRFSHFS